MALLTREAYEAENGTGSYPRLVLSMLSVMDSSATLSEALRMSWRAGAGSAIEHGLICAEDMTRDFMAAFVVYTQATRIEVEEAARKLRIANLDVFLNEHRPTNDMFPGYEHLTL